MRISFTLTYGLPQQQQKRIYKFQCHWNCVNQHCFAMYFTCCKFTPRELRIKLHNVAFCCESWNKNKPKFKGRFSSFFSPNKWCQWETVKWEKKSQHFNSENACWKKTKSWQKSTWAYTHRVWWLGLIHYTLAWYTLKCFYLLYFTYLLFYCWR